MLGQGMSHKETKLGPFAQCHLCALDRCPPLCSACAGGDPCGPGRHLLALQFLLGFGVAEERGRTEAGPVPSASVSQASACRAALSVRPLWVLVPAPPLPCSAADPRLPLYPQAR